MATLPFRIHLCIDILGLCCVAGYSVLMRQCKMSNASPSYVNLYHGFHHWVGHVNNNQTFATRNFVLLLSFDGIMATKTHSERADSQP